MSDQKLVVSEQELADIIVALDYYAEDMLYRSSLPGEFDEMDDIEGVIKRTQDLSTRLSHLCPGCDDPLEKGQGAHPGCCSHEDVEVDDARDGAGGRLRYFCESCHAEVLAEPNEDGGVDWVLA